MSIARLTSGSVVTRQAITKHLHVLAGAGLGAGSATGTRADLGDRAGETAGGSRYLDHIADQWDEALGRLKAAVER